MMHLSHTDAAAGVLLTVEIIGKTRGNKTRQKYGIVVKLLLQTTSDSSNQRSTRWSIMDKETECGQVAAKMWGKMTMRRII